MTPLNATAYLINLLLPTMSIITCSGYILVTSSSKVSTYIWLVLVCSVT